MQPNIARETKKSDFLIDVERIRREAREGLDQGPVTSHYGVDRRLALKLLEGALATEWICVLRYSQHYHAAIGLHAEPVAKEFQEHAEEEREHASKLAERIKQLGGTPSLDPRHLVEAAHSQYVECDNLLDMIRENLVAERIAVASYQEMARFFGEGDPTSRKLIEDILANEEEHADDMADLIKAIDPEAKLD